MAKMAVPQALPKRRGAHLGRGPVFMRRRLRLLAKNYRYLGYNPSVSQLSACLSTMATSEHPPSNWWLLLALARRSKGTTIDCYHCSKGKVLYKGDDDDKKGTRVDCPRCDGSMRVATHGFTEPDHAVLGGSCRYGPGWYIQVVAYHLAQAN